MPRANRKIVVKHTVMLVSHVRDGETCKQDAGAWLCLVSVT